MSARVIKAAGLSGLLVLSACASPDQIAGYSQPNAGFASVSSTARTALNKDTVWIQNAAAAQANAERVHGLVHQRTISADTSVQVALLNNRGLQAAYADLGMSAADVWQQTMLFNPTLSVGVLGIGADGVGGFRSIEGAIAANIIALTTQNRRVAIADVHFRQAQLRAAEETLRVADTARRGWINAVLAFEVVGLTRQAEGTADAMSELAARLGETGAMSRADQAREHAFYAELAAETSKVRLAAQLAKEELTRAMGLWGTEVDYYVPDQLPALPGRITANSRIEVAALTNRVDLSIARLELEATAKRHRLTDATRMMSDLEIIAGIEQERENPGTGIERNETGRVEVAFQLPVFDTGRASLRSAELAYMRAANILAEQAVNVRSEARAAYLAYTSTHRIALHYRDTVLPLRRTIEEEAMLSYNGMITNTFDLLNDTRERLETTILEAEARREFWLADAALITTIYGGSGASAPGATGE